ncbi:MAG: 4Fe-4S binding protein, partial [Spirochaetales bacterium]|nr:4Fe-4S binding protein [Spirochaetales bacterium]
IFGSITGVIFGKVFCRWMCPIGLLMEVHRGIRDGGRALKEKKWIWNQYLYFYGINEYAIIKRNQKFDKKNGIGYRTV